MGFKILPFKQKYAKYCQHISAHICQIIEGSTKFRNQVKPAGNKSIQNIGNQINTKQYHKPPFNSK